MSVAAISKSSFVSAYADTGDTTRFGPTAQAAAHLFSAGTTGDLILRDPSTTTGAAWLPSVAAGQVLASGGAGAAPAWSASPTLTSLTIDGAGTGVTLTNSSLAVLDVAGSIAATQAITAAGDIRAGAANYFYWLGRSLLNSPLNGQLNLTDQAAGVGVGFDVLTDALLKIRTRAQTGDASISALLFQVMTAIVAAGGGAAPTFTTIGGSGPAVAAQNGWLKFTDSGGVACYCPVWK